MALASTCPEATRVEGTLRSGGSSEVIEALAHHLEECSECANRVEELLSKDDLVVDLQTQINLGDTLAVQSIEHIIRRMQAIRVPDAAAQATLKIGELDQDDTNGVTVVPT